jgi:hypothetical protein
MRLARRGSNRNSGAGPVVTLVQDECLGSFAAGLPSTSSLSATTTIAASFRFLPSLHPPFLFLLPIVLEQCWPLRIWRPRPLPRWTTPSRPRRKQMHRLLLSPYQRKPMRVESSR